MIYFTSYILPSFLLSVQPRRMSNPVAPPWRAFKFLRGQPNDHNGHLISADACGAVPQWTPVFNADRWCFFFKTAIFQSKTRFFALLHHLWGRISGVRCGNRLSATRCAPIRLQSNSRSIAAPAVLCFQFMSEWIFSQDKMDFNLL